MPMSYVYTLLEYYNSKKTVTKKSKYSLKDNYNKCNNS